MTGEGTLLLTGIGWPEQIQCNRHASQAWQEYPVPHPSVGGASQSSQRTQMQWTLLFQEFMADIRGEGYAGYPTFRDGWVANQIMDIARTGQSWTALSTDRTRPL